MRQRDRPHDGVDLAASEGEHAIASADGLVVGASFDAIYGYTIKIRHDEPLDFFGKRRFVFTSYTHLKSIRVKVGDAVRRAEPLGVVGEFPASGGVSHLHWTLCKSSDCVGTATNVDPIPFTVGCYAAGHSYSSEALELTYPLDCK